MKHITFDRVFKVCILILVSFFISLLYKTINKPEVGRYQVIQFQTQSVVVVDTKTGEVKKVFPKP